jgi:hypothetical protein
MRFLRSLALSFLPVFAPDDGAGADGGAPPAPPPDLADDPAISLLLGDDFLDDDEDLFPDDGEGPDVVADGEPDDDEDLEGFDPADPFGLGIGKEEKPAADPKPDDKPKPDDEPEAPAALPEALLAALRERAPEVVVATVPELVERVATVETANREMRTLQDDLDAAIQRHPGLEQVLEDLLRPPAEGGERVGLLEALGRHIEGVEIADGDDVADPEAARKQAREKGRLDAFREQQAEKARKEADDLKKYGEQAEADFETFAAETFTAADGTPDAAAAERFVREVYRFEKGDPTTGRRIPPAERFRIIHRGLNHDAIVRAAETAAEARGREAGRAEALKGRGGRSVNRPLGSGSGGAAPTSGKDPLGLAPGPANGVRHQDF